MPWSPAPWVSSGSAALAAALLDRGVDALRDVGRLRPDRHVDAARRAVEALLRRVVADAEDRFPHDRRDVGVRAGGDLTGDVDLARGDERLDCDAAAWIGADQRVKNAVTDLISDLVRVALGDRLGGKEAPCHSAPS
jgi:hypothetical protein